jgi:hypothetical protein
MPAIIDETAIQIAYAHRDVAGIEDALEHTAMVSRGGPESFGCWTESFRDYFALIAKRGDPLKDVGSTLLWMSFVNLVRDEVGSKQKEATNLLLRPIAEALTAKMNQGDVGSLTNGDVARLTHVAGETSRKATWLNEENRAAAKELASASVQQWIRMYDSGSAKGKPTACVP